MQIAFLSYKIRLVIERYGDHWNKGDFTMAAEQENLVVAHFLGGKLAKGYSPDFNQNRNTFHVFTADDQIEGKLVYIDDLKAVFFVKTLEGNPLHEDPIFTEEEIKDLAGMKLKIFFKDGEVMYATSQGYSPARKGFFVFPIDKECNNEKVYINKVSTNAIEVIR